MKKYAGIFKAVHKRIGLDTLGVDVGVVDGRIVVFEANACMNYLTRAYGKDGRWLYRKDYVKGLKRAAKIAHESMNRQVALECQTTGSGVKDLFD